MATEETTEERIRKGLQADIPHLYANGFVNSLGIGDIITILECNNEPVCTLNMSYSVAKTLAVSLGQIISQYEESGGKTLPTTHEIHHFLTKRGTQQ